MFGPEFFPTPGNIAGKMMAKVSKDAENILEPSAGSGDLAMTCKNFGRDRWGDHHRRKVDCIEIQPELISVLRGKEFPIVGTDWLSYSGCSYYDAIVMNPPFSNGDEHLLKAWEFLFSGEIVCLLNEETIKNPCTERRQRLAQIIAENGGTVEYLGDCFSNARRKCDVRIAMVYLRKQSPDDRIEVWSATTEEKPVDGSIDTSAEDYMLAMRDRLGNMQHYYDQANVHWMKALSHIRRAWLYMEANGISNYRRGSGETQYEDILKLAMKNMNHARAEFGRRHRRDAWFRVFDMMDLHKFLDRKQREQLLRDVERDATIPFTADNIKGTLDNVFLSRRKLFEQSVANVFDELISHYKGNGATEGWKSNDNFRVNKRIVFPYGVKFDAPRRRGEYASYKFERLYSYSTPIDIYEDLDRVLCVLAGTRFEGCYTIQAALAHKFERLGPIRAPHFDNKCESEFFHCTFWKKGTLHLEWKDVKLWELFNITAAAGRQWLGSNTNGRSDFPGRKPTYEGREAAEPEPPAAEPVQEPDEAPAPAPAIALLPAPESKKARKQETKKAVDPARSAACKRAWDTIRRNRELKRQGAA